MVYGCILVLNGLGRIYWARLVTSMGTVLWVSAYHVCFGGFFSQSLAVGAAIIINYVAFRKKSKHMIPLFMLHAGIYFIALIYGISHEPLIELVDYPIGGLVSFIVSMAWVTLILIVFHQERENLIERLKAKNKELERTSNELERFSYIASHDLKSPLRTIVSFGNLIQRDIKRENFEGIDEKMNYLISGAQQMNYLVEGILELSQIKSIDKTDRSAIDLNVVLEKVKLNLKEEISTRNALIKSRQLPVLYGNEVEFLLLFQNIIQNAIKYNKNNTPSVTISTDQNQTEFLLSFQDNGIGIEEKYFTQIFEFFKRLHNVTEYPGTGIGLGLCKRIVENYSGLITVTSQVGRGSTFTITFPLEENRLLSPSEDKDLEITNSVY